MSSIRNRNPDDASHGGGIGDIPRQPVDPSSENTGEAEPVIGGGDAGGLDRERGEDAIPSGKDLEEGADEAEGQPS